MDGVQNMSSAEVAAGADQESAPAEVAAGAASVEVAAGADQESASAEVAAGADQESAPAEVAAGAASVEVAAGADQESASAEVAADVKPAGNQDPEAEGAQPTDPEAPPISVGRLGNLMSRQRQRKLHTIGHIVMIDTWCEKRARTWTRLRSLRLRAWTRPG